ncbi:MAG TPA: AAA family ATPase [Pseudobdellovibrionaceae bacterium]|jgi:predicted ATPase|nr:AAA family ATPase [Pseudobdellovibrionaceae bacterium]
MKCCKIALTGGPGGGKTTAVDLFRREIGDEIVVVPEAATILYSGGFPRSKNEEVRLATQRAIYHVQKNLEDIQANYYQGRVLMCDRGTIDGAAYWPSDYKENFFDHMKTTYEKELERYDAVIFFETAAVGGSSIEGGNPVRTESLKEAIQIDKHLRDLWSKHPNFHIVNHSPSFIHKINEGLMVMYDLLNSIRGKSNSKTLP